MDEAISSTKRERALWGTRPLYDFTDAQPPRGVRTNGLIRYSFSSKLGLSKGQRQQEKKPSTALQRLQRLGRISSEIEKERKETKDLVVGIEEVSTSLGVPYKVSSIANCRGFCLCTLICTERVHAFFTCVQSCNLLANYSSDGYVVPWLRHPGL